MQPNEFMIVPKVDIEEIKKKQNEILDLLKSHYTKSNSQLGEYMTEKESQALLGRKTTWFWEMRTAGLLKSKQLGVKHYYIRQDLIDLIDKEMLKK